MSLTIRVEAGDFDLYGDEKIVQNLSVFNFDDLSTRNGDVSPVFKLPPTNNNFKLIGYADYIINVNSAPYKKTECKILVNGVEIKKGLLIIDEITEDINVRFISGNSNFYNLIKNIHITDLDYSIYNHIWNYTNAVASVSNTSGYTYPVIDYNGQTLSGNIVDVRKILPATFVRTVLDLLFSEFDYLVNYNFDTTELDNLLLPYAKKNPTISAEVLLLNQLDVAISDTYSPSISDQIKTAFAFYNYPFGIGVFYNDVVIPLIFNTISTPGSSTLFNFTNNIFTPQYAGNYDYDFTVDLTSYDYMTFAFSFSIAYTIQTTTEIRIYKISGGVKTLYDTKICSKGFADSIGTSVTTVPQTYSGGTDCSGTIFLNQGESLVAELHATATGTNIWRNTSNYGDLYVQITSSFAPEIINTTYGKVNLQSAINFGSLITYSSVVPKIKANDFFKDICIRFGLLVVIDENTKTVNLDKFDKVYNNLINYKNWSNKLSDEKKPTVSFKFDTYAQNNYFNHKEDKSVIVTNNSTNFNLTVGNNNLELEKIIYTSPFAPSENSTFGGNETAYIDLYDTTTIKFNKDVQPRIVNSEFVINTFIFTDGTSTSAKLDVRRVWFIDDTLPERSLGFGFMLPQYSQLLIDTLREIKIIKADFDLTETDIKNLDYLTPVYIERLQSYFFISNINQFCYNEPELTEVELIKLNT